MELIEPGLSVIERWGIVGVLVLVIAALVMTVIRLDGRNQSLVDKHLDDKVKQIEGASTTNNLLAQILKLVERMDR
jgi:hypothetical protein